MNGVWYVFFFFILCWNGNVMYLKFDVKYCIILCLWYIKFFLCYLVCNYDVKFKDILNYKFKILIGYEF